MSGNSESVAEKAVETVGGILQKLVDLRLLVLAMAFIVYLDIWLIYENVDVMSKTIADVLSTMHSLTVKTLFFFVASFSLIMTVTIPSVRAIYSAIMLHYGPSSIVAENRGAEEKQFSCWCTALLFFTIWNYLASWFTTPDKYQGLTSIVFSQLELDGFLIGIFRITVAGILFFCFMRTVQADL
ncbi:hypothetical protein [Herbaspirillum rubrisubalbicans]|uniref:Uncharacterized protein n=1 Tax=Herbaspirillum rubrisubalbicans TaxID=80842 RepID=A0AAD0XES4_9BURK|nr:hypothetical protein [Herbaspirillum rubrisubalbicans]AYR23406.1 hypothetical protein RC54_06015 [Herbaspirillum rubrisubalbicans]